MVSKLFGGTDAPNYQAAFSDFGGAASDLFSGFADQYKAKAALSSAAAARASGRADLLKGQGDAAEGEAYGKAATLADLNAQFTAQSTRIQEAQADRALYLNIGQAKADIAESGGTEGGSAGDILRASAAQGALSRAVLDQQGLITEAGYEEQANSYRAMQTAAGFAVSADSEAAAGEESAAQGYEATAAADKEAATGSDISSIIKGVAGVAALVLAPATGGASLVAEGVLEGGLALGQGGIGHA